MCILSAELCITPPSLGLDNKSKCTLCHGCYKCPPWAAIAFWASGLPRGMVWEPKNGRFLAHGTLNNQVNTGQYTGAMYQGNGISSQWHNRLIISSAALLTRARKPQCAERTDSRVAAAYINRQERWGNPCLYWLSQKLCKQAHPWSESLRVMYRSSEACFAAVSEKVGYVDLGPLGTAIPDLS